MARPLADHASFGPVNKSTIGLLKLMNRLLLPIQYGDSIYNVIKEGAQARAELLYLYGDTAVGEICWRLEAVGDLRRLYIMTIGVLPTYQRQGLGRLLLERAISEAQKVTPINEIYLHVHVENFTGQAFYESVGFTRGPTEVGYYKSLANGDAVVFTKPITPP